MNLNVIPSIDIVSVRKKTGLSQQKFADKFGFTCKEVQEFESGRRKLKASIILIYNIIDTNPDAVSMVLKDAD